MEAVVDRLVPLEIVRVETDHRRGGGRRSYSYTPPHTRGFLAIANDIAPVSFVLLFESLSVIARASEQILASKAVITDVFRDNVIRFVDVEPDFLGIAAFAEYLVLLASFEVISGSRGSSYKFEISIFVTLSNPGGADGANHLSKGRF